MPANAKRFTIYDMMEAKGEFEKNPANASSPNYAGPKEFPKMLYHPQGKERVTVPAEIVVTPFGPERHGEQRETISVVVKDQAEEAKYLAEGWHRHPADAIKARTGVRPATHSDARIGSLESEIERLKAELAAANEAKAKTLGDEADPMTEL